jgi:hypothetical protein
LRLVVTLRAQFAYATHLENSMRLFPLALLVLSACDIDNTLGDGADDPPAFDTGTPWTPGGGVGEDTADTDSGGVVIPAEECESQQFVGGAIPQLDECFAEEPTAGTFTPVVTWDRQSFTIDSSSTNCMMQPIVCSLDDDDGNGRIDEADTADVVIITYSGGGSPPTVLRALSGVDGSELWGTTGGGTIQITGGAACGDIDSDGLQEVVAAASSGVEVFDNEGNSMWSSSACGGHMDGTSDAPAIADLDGDGNPEIIIGNCILDNDGDKVGAGSSGWGSSSNVGSAGVNADINQDGYLEVVAGNALYDYEGNTLWTNGESDGYPAVGNFDSDDYGEIAVTGDGQMRVLDDDGTVLCRASIPGASGSYGGPPTIADFDGDLEAEIGVAANSTYTVFETDCSILWQVTGTTDPSSGNTGSSVFDFEGDGVADVVYADEHWVWVFDGRDGAIKMQDEYHSNNTWLEYPSVADIDGDGSADIAVCNTPGSWGSYGGVTVFGDADGSWRPGRRIWNQHAYSITNVNDDGSIPRYPDTNWLTYNNFRSGDLTPGNGYSGPDLEVQIPDICTVECASNRITVWLQVKNQGFNDIEDPVNIDLWGETSLGLEYLSTYIWNGPFPAGQQTASVEVELIGVPTPLSNVIAYIDGGGDSSAGVVDECHEDNNVTWWDAWVCP